MNFCFWTKFTIRDLPRAIEGGILSLKRSPNCFLYFRGYSCPFPWIEPTASAHSWLSNNY